MRRALRTLARADDVALADYGTPLGLPPLRQLLARRMGEHGIEASPDQIMLTESGTQAIDLLCRFLHRTRRHGAGRRPLLLQFPRPAARPSRQGRQRSLHADGTGHRAVRAGAGRASAAPLHHQFRASTIRPARRCRRSSRIGCSSSPTSSDLTIVEDDIFADFETHAGAAARGLRRARPRRPYRQLLQDAVGLGALRLHRRAAATGSRA